MGTGIFSVRFWLQTFVSVFITMVIIYLIKRYSAEWNIPFVKTIAQGV